MGSVGGRRLSFWVAVGGVSILAQFALEVITEHVPAEGLHKFVAYTHRGHGPK